MTARWTDEPRPVPPQPGQDGWIGTAVLIAWIIAIVFFMR